MEHFKILSKKTDFDLMFTPVYPSESFYQQKFYHLSIQQKGIILLQGLNFRVEFSQIGSITVHVFLQNR